MQLGEEKKDDVGKKLYMVKLNDELGE